MKKIDFMIIGVQKAATTSLAYYLSQHPNICKHKSEEMPYFTLEDEYKLGYKVNFQRYFNHYEDNNKVLAKSVTVIQDIEIIKRVYQHNPKMKIILVLRNPVDRAYSAFCYAKRMGWETMDSFEEALRSEGNRNVNDMVVQRITQYKENGNYLKQINNFYKIFPKEQVIIFLQEDLVEDTNKVCQKVFSYFGLDEYRNLNLERINESAVPRFLFISKIFNANHPLKKRIKQSLPLFIQRFIDRSKSNLIKLNETKSKNNQLKLETREFLLNYYSKMNKELESLINRNLSHWDN